MSPVYQKARVKFFNGEKSYGFVLTEDGREAFLHLSVLKASRWPGPDPLTDERVLVQVQDHARGLRVTAIQKAV